MAEKMNVGGKRKENVSSLLKGLKIAFEINIDEERKTFSIQKKASKTEETLENLLIDVIRKYYFDKGYTTTDTQS